MIPSNLNTAKEIIDDHESMSELFNDFFINVGKNLVDAIKPIKSQQIQGNSSVPSSLKSRFTSVPLPMKKLLI